MKKEEILKFYTVYKLYIFPIGVALSSLILIIFVIYPQTSKLLSNQKVEGEFLNKSQFLETKASELEKYDPSDLDLKVSYALGTYPADKDFATVVGLLQNITNQSGFSINTLSLGTGTSKIENSQSYGIKLDLVGPEALIPALISDIESSPRLMRVGSIEAVTGRDAQSMAVSMSIDVLFASAPTGFGSVDSPTPQLSKKDEEILSRIARSGGPLVSQTQQPISLGPRGKSNPFE